MIVTACSGLASRCRMLADAYYLVKEIEEEPELIIEWTMQENCCKIPYDEVFSKRQFQNVKVVVNEVTIENPYGYISLRDLFKRKKMIQMVSTFIKRELWNISFRMKEDRKHQGYHTIRYNDMPNVSNGDFSLYSAFMENKWAEIKDIIEKGEKLHIFCHESFIVPRENVTEKVKKIQFKEELVEKSNQIMNNHKNAIGIHIRGTDHVVAKQHSPIELFMEKMDVLISENNDVEFFLATDEDSVAERLTKKYGARIIRQQDFVNGRNDTKSMQCGIIDMLCLSKCKKIIGSFTSQFSGFAAEYGDIEIEICRK